VSSTVTEEFEFELGAASTSAIRYRGPEARATLVLAHGAGAPQRHPWMVAMARAISNHPLDVVTFDFLYAHAKRRVPDRLHVLEATWRAALAAVRAQTQTAAQPLFVGGKSMGGRIATQVAAQGGFGQISGVVLLGYPLHPPGKPERLRAAHLPKVAVPMLFVQGSRDAFGTLAELTPIVASLPTGGTLLAIEGADHSLAPAKRGPESLPDVMERVAREIARFCGVEETPLVTSQQSSHADPEERHSPPRSRVRR
jgi:predicted alpha/beta-hydrolase family hydrolase